MISWYIDAFFCSFMCSDLFTDNPYASKISGCEILCFLYKQIIKELKMLCDECRSNSCIEHATGIMEEVKAPENLSKRISNMSLTGADKKVLLSLLFFFFSEEKPNTFLAHEIDCLFLSIVFLSYI